MFTQFLSKLEDMAQIHIESKVAIADDRNIFHKILKEGYTGNNTKEEKKNLYLSNFNFFKTKNMGFAKKTSDWDRFVITILEKVIFLPIEYENVDLALTIFTTLNDQGMPLSDSDIFKEEIYKNKENQREKEEFIEKWQQLTKLAQQSQIEIDHFFRYYSHIIRAKAGMRKREIGLRKLYMETVEGKPNARLQEPALMDNLVDLAEFWQIIYYQSPSIDEKKIINAEAKQYLHCLLYYPNEYWKYIVSVFYYHHREDNEFAKDFLIF